MYQLQVASADSVWVGLYAENNLGGVLAYAVSWYRNREQLGDYRLPYFRVVNLSTWKVHIKFRLGMPEESDEE